MNCGKRVRRIRTFGFLNLGFYGVVAQGFFAFVYSCLEEFQMKVELGDPSRRTNSSCCLEKFATGICFEDIHCTKRLYYIDCIADQIGMI